MAATTPYTTWGLSAVCPDVPEHFAVVTLSWASTFITTWLRSVSLKISDDVSFRVRVVKNKGRFTKRVHP